MGSPALPALTTHLVEMATLEDGYQPDHRLTVFQGLVEDGVGVALNGGLLAAGYFSNSFVFSFQGLCYEVSGQ